MAEEDNQRRSTTGTAFPVADMTNWRRDMQESRLKFDDKLKGQFLIHLSKHGKKTLAARQCDITYMTYKDHFDNDPEFAEWVEIALEERAHRIVNQLEEEAMSGHEEDIVNKDGDVVGTRIKYETQLRVLMLKRYDPEYKDRQEIDMNVQGGGVLVAPAAMTPDEWVKQARALKDKMQADGMIEDKDAD